MARTPADPDDRTCPSCDCDPCICDDDDEEECPDCGELLDDCTCEDGSCLDDDEDDEEEDDDDLDDDVIDLL